MLNDISQFAYIARPVMILQDSQRVITEQLIVGTVSWLESQEKMHCQAGDIFGALSQRRQVDFESIDAKHQVLAEFVSGYHVV